MRLEPADRLLAVAGIGLLLAAAMVRASTESEVRQGAPNTTGLEARGMASVSSPPPLLFRKASPQEALALNAAIPLSEEPNQPARPFRLAVRAAGYSAAVQCLTSAIYYEAGNQAESGQQAVAQVILNRVRHPAFPNSICGVVYQGSVRNTGCQFTFTCDGSLVRRPDASRWAAARAIAVKALTGAVDREVGLATHYHADYVVPYWATSLSKNSIVGTHIFYRWPGWWGRQQAFRQRYGGERPDAGQLRIAALLAHGEWPASSSAADLNIAVARDPRLEVLGIVQLLADGSMDAPHGADVRRRFAEEVNHPAVQLYRKLLATQGATDFPSMAALVLGGAGGAKAAATGFIPDGRAEFAPLLNSLAQFELSPSYAAFARHRPAYARDTKRARAELAPLITDLQLYTGFDMGPRNLTVAPVLGSLMRQGAVCEGATSSSRTDGHKRVEERLALSALDYVEWSKLTQAASAACPQNVDRQVIGAIVSRVAALKSGEAAGRARVAWEVRRGNTLVPEFAQRLRLFEKQRDRYPTLGGFYPLLIAGDAKQKA